MTRRAFADWYLRLDLRSLALFRILLGGVLIADWCARWPFVEAFYAAGGVVPVEPPRLHPWLQPLLLFQYMPSLPATRLLFGLGLLAYLLLTTGTWTRVAQVGSWYFFWNLLHRNPLIMHSGDRILHLLLLWSLFLPLGARWSLDAARARRAGRISEHPSLSPPSLAVLAMLVQLALVYLLSVLARDSQPWQEGTMYYYAGQADLYASTIGRWVALQPLWVSRLLTWGTIGLEYTAALLILSPVGQPACRRTALGAAVAANALGWALMDWGLFWPAMLASCALLVTPADWDAVQRWTGQRPVRYEPVRAPRVRHAPLVATTIVISCLLVTALVSAYNFILAPQLRWRRLPTPRVLATLTHDLWLYQAWGLLVPKPSPPGAWWADDGWWVMEGQLASGATVELLTGRPVTWDKPAAPASPRLSRFWRACFVALQSGRRGTEPWLAVARHFARRYQHQRMTGSPIVHVRMHFLRETTLPPGNHDPFPVQRLLLWQYAPATDQLEMFEDLQHAKVEF